VKKLIAIASLCVLASGCAEFKEDLREIRDFIRTIRGREPAPPPLAPPVVTQPQVPVAGLTLSGSCIGREETGYAENVRIDVAGGSVRVLDARIDIPNRGSCRYQLAEFRQTRQLPYVELLSRTNAACAVRMWQQGDRVTVAATDCPEKCTRGAFEYLCPIELKSPGGGCY